VQADVAKAVKEGNCGFLLRESGRSAPQLYHPQVGKQLLAGARLTLVGKHFIALSVVKNHKGYDAEGGEFFEGSNQSKRCLEGQNFLHVNQLANSN